MKYLILFLLPNICFAQMNHVPLSEAERYIEAASRGEGVPGLYECKDKPDEQCIDFSKCESWEVCEIQNELQDVPVLEEYNNESCSKEDDDCQKKLEGLKCDDKDPLYIKEDFSEVYCIRVKRIDQVETGRKILVNSEAKKAAKKVREDAEKVAKKEKEDTEKAKESEKKSVKAELKALDQSKIKTVADVKDVLAKVLKILEE